MHNTDNMPPAATSLNDRSTIDDAFVAQVARAADVDARSVVRRLAGLPVRGRTGRRIDRALAEAAIGSISPVRQPGR